MLNDAILEANLNALQTQNPDLAQRLRRLPTSTRIEFSDTPQEILSATFDGKWLASRHRPREEAERLTAKIDIIENAVVVVLGFGLGYHVETIARRMGTTGIVVVFETDDQMLRDVLSTVDHSSWIRECNLVFFNAQSDRAEVAARMDGAGSIIALGTTILEHPASRPRLGSAAAEFSSLFAEVVGAIRTTILTTLVHCVTTCRNLALNVDHYACGEGIAPLAGWATGHPAIVVAAGPSLARNVALLEDPEVRERVVIIAAQTVLKPLLARGIKPHFVTALDYHEISRQFYDGLDPEMVEGVTLVCEAKANRAILEGFPGHVRCTGNGFLDRLLGPLARDMGELTPGATVAHLSFYLAQFLGCDPIMFIGQDLGFTDGLYYGPNASIHQVWASELNRFNTIEMMEWSRVARMKRTLRKVDGIKGQPVFTDEQMMTYRQQFERDFAAAPQTIIDATEGGVSKQHTTTQSLADALDAYLPGQPLPPMPDAHDEWPPARVRDVRSRIREVRSRVVRFGDLSRRADRLLDSMLENIENPREVGRLFDEMDLCRGEVGEMPDILGFVNDINQLGVFNRIKADRRLQLSDLSPMDAQRAQMERDQINVRWLADAAAELALSLEESDRILGGGTVDSRISRHHALVKNENDTESPTDIPERAPVVAAMIAVDPACGSLGLPWDPLEDVAGRPLLERTLSRVARTEGVDRIVLVQPAGCDLVNRLDISRIDCPVVPCETNGPVFDSSHDAIMAARRWSETCWRGGVGGTSIYDEILAPNAMLSAMEQLEIDAAIIVGADWVCVDPSGETGCGSLVARFVEQPSKHHIVFSQAPPGLVGCLLTRNQMREQANQVRNATIGALLSYMPHMPQLDPITKEICIKVPATIRDLPHRFTFDTRERRERLLPLLDTDHAMDIVGIMKHRAASGVAHPAAAPREVEIDLGDRHAWMTPDTLAAVLTSIDQFPDPVAITVTSSDESLCHPQLSDLIGAIATAKPMAINLRTQLRTEDAPERIMSLPVDVVTVLLDADCQATYRTITGRDEFPAIMGRLERLINLRGEQSGDALRLCRPWIVPTLRRCRDNVQDIETFFDRWLYHVGAAVIEPGVPSERADDIIHLEVPPTARARHDQATLYIGADGSVLSAPGADVVGSIPGEPIVEVWRRVLDGREAGSLAEVAG